MKHRLSVILEHWATLYKPISHKQGKGGKKAFYRIHTINDNSEFMRNQNVCASPCMAYSILIDAESSNSKAVNYAHTIYFLSRAVSSTLATTARQDDELAEDIHSELDNYAQDLLYYLSRVKATGLCPVTDEPFPKDVVAALNGLNIDKAEWASIPIKYGNWNILGIQIEQVVPRVSCINPSDYNIPDLKP